MADISKWDRRVRSSGEIELTSPDHIRIAIRERVRPIKTLRAITGGATGRPMRTVEGEDALVASFDRDGTKHTVAVIEGDDFQTIIDGSAARPEQATFVRAAVTEVAMHFPLGLGALRVRRVQHTGPEGWRQENRGLGVVWHAPDDDATIKVLPARPLGEVPRAVQLATLCHDDRFDELVLEHPLEQRSFSYGAFLGTFGRAIGHYRGGSRRTIVTAGFTDTLFRYVVRLDRSEQADHDNTFSRVIASCTPIAVRPHHAAALGAMAHWAD